MVGNRLGLSAPPMRAPEADAGAATPLACALVWSEPGAPAADGWVASAHLDLVLDSLHDHAVLTLDGLGYVTTWNVGASHTKGYAAEEIIGRHFSCFYTPADQAAEAPARALAHAASAGRHEAEGWRVRKDGSLFWASVVIQPIRDAGSVTRGFVKVTRDISHRLQIERLREALHRAQQQELQLLAENTSDIVMRQHGAALVYVSAACQPMLGWSPEQMLQIGLPALLHPQDQAQAPGPSGATWWRGRMRRRDGTYRWVETSCDPRQHAQGGGERLLVARDMDRQMRAITQLHESEERYRLLAEHASDLIVRVGTDRRYRYVSPACFDILGFTPQQMLEMGPTALIHPHDLAGIEAIFSGLLEGRDRVAVSFRKQHRAGHWVWLESRAALVRDAAGRPLEIIGVLRDVTASREVADRAAAAAAELRATNALLRRAEAMTHIGHWHLNIRTQELAWSEEVFRIFGLPQGSPPTLDSVLAAYHPDDRARVRLNVERAVQLGAPYSADARIIRPNGEVRHVSTFSDVEYDSAGRLTMLFGTFQDVTERHDLEADLRQAQKLEAVGRVAAGIAHDFNNVLQAVMGGLSLILDPATPMAEGQEFAAIALKSARRGAAITSGLLSYARRQVLQPRRVSLGPLLQELREILLPGLPASVHLEIACAPDCPPVDVDPQYLLAALEHLATNSVQAMPQGGALRLRVLQDRGSVLLTVSDTGLGMDSATLGQAFEPFFSTRGLHGTGLGLSMVQGFARQSGGEVWIASVPGQGTCVEMRLPSAAVPLPEPTDGTPRQPGGRVLLVDDMADVLVVVAAFLRGAGFEVVQVSDGEQALAQLAEGARFSALITDYAMPGMNGIDLILQARALQPELAGLLISGFTELTESRTMPHDVQLLTKPFQREDVVAALRRSLRMGDRAAAAV